MQACVGLDNSECMDLFPLGRRLQGVCAPPGQYILRGGDTRVIGEFEAEKKRNGRPCEAYKENRDKKDWGSNDQKCSPGDSVCLPNGRAAYENDERERERERWRGF